MLNQSNASSPIQNFAPDQDVQAVLQASEWLSLPEAVEKTNLHEKTIRRYIKNNRLKARKLGRNSNSPLQVWITPEFLQQIGLDPTVHVETVDSEDHDLDSRDEAHDDGGTNGAQSQSEAKAQTSKNDTELMQELVRAMTEQFSAALNDHKEQIFVLRNELQEKDVQLRLLPDLQKQLEEKEKIAEYEQAAINKQLELLKEENEKLRAEAEMLQNQAKKTWWGWFLGKS